MRETALPATSASAIVRADRAATLAHAKDRLPITRGPVASARPDTSPPSTGFEAPPPNAVAPLLPGLPRADLARPDLARGDRPARAPRPPVRWSGSAWLVVRGGSGLAPGALGGQLGGSQAGLRLAYTVSARQRLALAARVATPLGTGLREAALGVEWQPTRLPVRLIVERRFALSGGADGTGVGIVGGVGPTAVAEGFRIEAYAQAGVIRRVTEEPYADGAARIAHPVAKARGARIDLGAGVWGAAQRGAARLDIGPSLALNVPVAKHAIRLTLDWRQRVAGNARPGSGAALTVGTDF